MTKPGQPRTQQGQGGVDTEVAKPHANHAAGHKPTDTGTRETVSDGVGKRAEHKGRHEQPPEIGPHRAVRVQAFTGAGGVERENKAAGKAGSMEALRMKSMDCNTKIP